MAGPDQVTPLTQLSLLVAFGSALGGLARYWAGIGVARLLGSSFPWGTLLINVVGSMVIGAAAAATNEREHAAYRAFVMVGICGGFTTFSAFSLQTLDLLQAGRMPAAMAYAGLSLGMCLLSVWAGWALGTMEWG